MTWPPGDPRGHWSPLFDFYGELVAQGGQLNLPDPITYKRSVELAKESPRILTTEDQHIVAETIGEIFCHDFNNQMPIHGLAIEKNHVHLLLGEMTSSIDQIVGRVKSKTSSQLIQRGSEPNRKRTWTTGYWKVFIFDSGIVPAVQQYIENHNIRQGLPAVPFAWIRPYCTQHVNPGHARG